MTADMRPSTLFLLGALAPAMLASSVSAQAAPPLTLSDSEKADLLSRNTEDTVNDARAGLGGSARPGRQVHGEVGAMVGSNGARAIYGTAAIPLGDDAGAVVSFERSQYGRRR